MRILLVVYPVSGGQHASVPRVRERTEHAVRELCAAGAHAAARLTDAPGHATALASSAAAEGADCVVAWGGDGTVIEVV